MQGAKSHCLLNLKKCLFGVLNMKQVYHNYSVIDSVQLSDRGAPFNTKRAFQELPRDRVRYIISC